MKNLVLTIALASLVSTTAWADGWQRVRDENLFRIYFIDKMLIADGSETMIHSDGRISGTVSGKRLTGAWNWQRGFFCRRAVLDGNDLGTDCQKIEIKGNQLRYTRDRGRGRSTVLTVQR